MREIINNLTPIDRQRLLGLPEHESLVEAVHSGTLTITRSAATISDWILLEITLAMTTLRRNDARTRSLAASTLVLLLHMLTAFFRSAGALPIFILFVESSLSMTPTKELHCLRDIHRSPECWSG
jgi:hypothetical protein